MLLHILAHDLLLLICGTAVGNESVDQGAYFADPRNRFWRILRETGLTTRKLAPEEFPQLLGHRIGLTDIVKDQAGNDADIDFTRAYGSGWVVGGGALAADDGLKSFGRAISAGRF